MNDEQIANLESEFGIRFPVEYRDNLHAYAFAGDTEEFTADVSVLSECNHGIRAEPPWGFQWEDRFWWVGGDGSGGLFFINCQDEPCRVYYLDHENPAESFADQSCLKPRLLTEFISDLRQAESEWEEVRQRLLKRIAERRWWQFWIPKLPPAWARDSRD